MASAIWKVALTMIVPTAFGMMCRTTIRPPPPPIARTACTYSRVRSVSVSPRMRRAGTSQAASATMNTISQNDGFKIAAITISRNSVGIERTVSTILIMTASMTPPSETRDGAEKYAENSGDARRQQRDLESGGTAHHEPPKVS